MVASTTAQRRQWVAAVVVLVVLLSISLRSDLAMTPSAVTCESLGYSYDAAGRLVAVHDRANLTARYAYDDAGNPTLVQRLGSPDLSVDSFVPVAGAVGSSVTLSGGCFGDDPDDYDVAFNGVAAPVTAADEHRLVATVPPGASTGKITVTGNGASVTTAEDFVVAGSTAAPAISAVTPAVVAPGDTVTVTGSAFATVVDENVVWLNSTVARVLAATATTLSVRVPDGASSGRVRVRTVNGVATSPTDTFVAPIGRNPPDVASTQRRLGDGAQTIALPPTGKVALLTFDLATGQRASVQTTGATPATAPAAVAVSDPFGRPVPVPSETQQRSGNGNRYVDAFTAAVPGTYTAAFTLEPGDVPGPISVTVHAVPADVTATSIVDGPAVAVPLVKPGQNGVVRFEGTAGQRVAVLFTPGSLTMPATDTIDVAVRAPSGATIASSSLHGADAIAVSLPATGPYRVVVDPSFSQVGTASVRVLNLPSDLMATAAIGGPPVTVTTTVPAQNAEVTFAAASGTKVYIHLSSTMDCDIAFKVWKPGEAHTTPASPTTFKTKQVTSPTINATGTWTVGLDPRCVAAGPITVQVFTDQTVLARTMTLGGPPAAVSTVAYQNANVTFSATAGQRVAIRLSDSTYAPGQLNSVLKDPSGVANIWAMADEQTGPPGTVIYAELLVSGTHTLFIDPGADAVGSVNVSLVNVPAAAIDGPAVPIDAVVPGAGGYATFDATAGAALVLTFNTATLTGSRVVVQGPSGPPRIQSVMQGTETRPLTITTTGRYVVLFDAPDGVAGSGSFQVAHMASPTTATTTVGASPVTATIAYPGQFGDVTFPGGAGMWLVLRLSDATFTGPYWVQLLDGSGQQIDDFSPDGPAQAYAIDLWDDDTYTVRVSNSNGQTGSVKVSVELAPADVTATATVGGAPVTLAMTQEFQRGRLTFTGTAGQSVVAAFTGLTAQSPYYLAALLDADGTYLDVSPVYSPSGLGLYTLPADGTYALLLTGAPGSVTVGLSERPPDVTASTSVGAAPTALTLSQTGQRGMVSFAGTANSRVYLTLSASTFPLGYVLYRVYGPDGEWFAIGHHSLESSIEVLDLPATGVYTVELQPELVATGSISIAVTEVAADATASTTVDGPAVTVATGPGQRARVAFPGLAGQHVTLSFAAATYPSYVEFEIEGPDGAVLDDDSFVASSHDLGVDLHDDGTYIVVITPNEITSGSLELTIAGLAAPNSFRRPAVAVAQVSQVAQFAQVTQVSQVAQVEQDECTPAAGDAPSEDGQEAGDPVDLGSGLFLEKHTDLALPDVLPISLTRTYRQRDDILRSFAAATTFEYEGTFLQWVHPTLIGNLKDQIWLIQPDSTKVLFNVTTSVTDGFRFAAVGTTGPSKVPSSPARTTTGRSPASTA